MRILWFVSTIEDTNFLKEFRKSFSGEIDVFNINFITWIDLCRFEGEKLLPVYKKTYGYATPFVDLNKNFSVLSGRLTISSASKAYTATIEVLNKYLSNKSSEVIFVIPSGRLVHHVAATEMAKEKGVKRIYINYANFPGYTFFDPLGTDKQSSIFANPSRLDTLFKNVDVDVDEVFERFSNIKKHQKSIPQVADAGIKKIVKKVAFKVDTFLQTVFSVVGDRRVKILSNGQSSKYHSIVYDSYNLEADYVFFPLQVSTDQQVLLNYSGGSIYKAIEEAIAYSVELDKVLLIREHPAEANKNQVREYLESVRGQSVLIVDYAVPELLENCSEVVTVNSTVGLEARLQKKRVKFLGDSFYEKANDYQLSLYLDKYFVPVDYHKPVLNSDLVQTILGKSSV